MRVAAIALLAAAGCAALVPSPVPAPQPDREVLGSPGGVAPAGSAPKRPYIPVPVLPYAGRCAKDPRFPGRLREIQEVLAGCMEEVRTRLGLLNEPPPRLQVQFEDTRFYGHNRIHLGNARELSGNAQYVQAITLRTEPFLSGDCDLALILRHELVHCFQFKFLGGEMDKLPQWVVEGLAEWGTGYGRRSLEAELLECGTQTGFSPVGLLIGGLSSERRSGGYGEFNLAFQMMEERFGVDAVRLFLKELAVLGDVSRALRRSTGRDLETFVQEARPWSEERVRRDIVDRGDYLPAREAFEKKEWAVARGLYDAFLARHPESLFLPRVCLERAECRMETGDPEGMERDLRACEASEPLRGMWNNHRRWIRLRQAAGDERWADVERDGNQFVADYEMGYGLFYQSAYVLVRRAQDELAGRKPWK